MRTVTVKLPEDMLRAVEAWAKALTVSRSELIRRAIEYYIRWVEKEGRGPRTGDPAWPASTHKH